jgi:hypothetical protein
VRAAQRSTPRRAVGRRLVTLARLINRPCTIVRRSGSGDVDELGDEVEGETRVESVCEVQQRQREEPAALGEISDTRWVAFLPAGTEIDTGDAIDLDGDLYELVGDPWRARNPRTGAESHVEATVRRVAGAGEGQGS